MNTQIIEFYAKLLQIRLLCREAVQLGEHLQVPDNALIGGMDYLDGRITEHLAAAQWSIKPSVFPQFNVCFYCKSTFAQTRSTTEKPDCGQCPR